MAQFIGDYGSLMLLKCPSVAEVSTPEIGRVSQTLGGRVVTQRGPLPRRTWRLEWPVVRPADAVVLDAFKYGAHGVGPFCFLSPEALSVNALSPRESLLDAEMIQEAASAVGARTAVDGVRVPRTVLVPAGEISAIGRVEDNRRWSVPVLPGQTWTASVYGFGAGADFRVRFRRDDGSVIRSVASVPFDEDVFSRRSLTVVIPDDCDQVTLELRAGDAVGGQFGAPAITLGEQLMPFGVGRGCHRAVVLQVEDVLKRAIVGSEYANFSGFQMTVQEVI